jgi:SAM-dependent methyltransferase
VAQPYDAPLAYERLIAPRYAPIAEALVEAAALRRDDRALELGAGTGLVTRMAADRVAALVATDREPAMLEFARGAAERPTVSFVVVDYAAPLPFLDASFDVVLSGLTYVQDAREPLDEVARVVRPGGRVALAMWGTSYLEARLIARARRAVGLAPAPPAAPGRAVRRLQRAGFEAVARRDLELAPRFDSVDAYLAYRRGFGSPPGWTRAQYERALRALRAEAARITGSDGSVTIGWKLAILTARKPLG